MKNKKLAIFGALAIGGIVLTAVTTAWGTAKAVRKIDEVKPETKKEAAKLVWKYYIPAGLSIGLTIISDVCFYRIGLKEIAVLTSSVTYLTANKSKLEKKLKEVVGEEKFEEIKKEIREEIQTETLPRMVKSSEKEWFPTIEETGYGDTLICDHFSGRIFRSDPIQVQKSIDSFNDAWLDGYSLSYNELYSRWNIVQTGFGEANGYPKNDDVYDTRKPLHFTTEMMEVDEIDPLSPLAKYKENVFMVYADDEPTPEYKDLILSDTLQIPRKTFS